MFMTVMSVFQLVGLAKQKLDACVPSHHNNHHLLTATCSIFMLNLLNLTQNKCTAVSSIGAYELKLENPSWLWLGCLTPIFFFFPYYKVLNVSCHFF